MAIINICFAFQHEKKLDFFLNKENEHYMSILADLMRNLNKFCCYSCAC